MLWLFPVVFGFSGTGSLETVRKILLVHAMSRSRTKYLHLKARIDTMVVHTQDLRSAMWTSKPFLQQFQWFMHHGPAYFKKRKWLPNVNKEVV